MAEIANDQPSEAKTTDDAGWRKVGMEGWTEESRDKGRELTGWRDGEKERWTDGADGGEERWKDGEMVQ